MLVLLRRSILADILAQSHRTRRGGIVTKMSLNDLEMAPLRNLFIFGDSRLVLSQSLLFQLQNICQNWLVSHPTLKMSFHVIGGWLTFWHWLFPTPQHSSDQSPWVDQDCDRFEVPDTSDTGRWTNRVVNNLIYYQTNYFISALIVFSLIRLVDVPFWMWIWFD